MWSFLHSHRHLLSFHHWSKLHFFPWNLHLHLHDILFVKIFDSVFSGITLKTCVLKSSVLFGMHALLDKSLRTLQLPSHLSSTFYSKSIRIEWISHFWILKDTHFVWLEALAMLANNTIILFLIIQNILSYYVSLIKHPWIPEIFSVLICL